MLMELWRRFVPRPRVIIFAVLHLIFVTAVIMAISGWLDEIKDEFLQSEFVKAQANTYTAVASINPGDIFQRYICAITPSVAWTNKGFHAVVRRGITLNAKVPESDDCALTIAKNEPKLKSSSGAQDQKSEENEPLVPVVGHWSDGTNVFVAPILGFLDMVWHYVYQPTIIASILSLSIFLFGLYAGAHILVLVRLPPHPYVFPAVLGVVSVMVACIFAWCMQKFMQLGEDAFTWLSTLAPIKFGTSFEIAAGTMTFFWKMIDTFIHSVVDKIVPHLK